MRTMAPFTRGLFGGAFGLPLSFALVITTLDPRRHPVRQPSETIESVLFYFGLAGALLLPCFFIRDYNNKHKEAAWLTR